MLEDVFRTILKKYGDDENFDIIVNTDKGDLEIWHTSHRCRRGCRKLIYKFPWQAVKIEEDYEVGEDCYEQVTIESSSGVLSARQTLVTRVLEIEKNEIFQKYKDRVGIMSAEVYQIWKREILCSMMRGMKLCPKTEQIRGDFFKGECARSYKRG